MIERSFEVDRVPYASFEDAMTSVGTGMRARVVENYEAAGKVIPARSGGATRKAPRAAGEVVLMSHDVTARHPRLCATRMLCAEDFLAIVASELVWSGASHEAGSMRSAAAPSSLSQWDCQCSSSEPPIPGTMR